MDRGAWLATEWDCWENSIFISLMPNCLRHKTKGVELNLVALESESVSCSVVSDTASPWTVARQAPLSMGFSRPEYLSG